MLAACQPWLTAISPETAQTRIRLICAPFAGGSASAFRSWPKKNFLPSEIAVYAVELPGRGSRFAEPFAVSLEKLVQALLAAVEPALGAPFACFGHSLGAVIMLEFARQLQQRQSATPVRLILSGQRALHRPPPHPPIHNLPDEEFVAEIQRYGGTPHGLFDNPELRNVFLPLLRADFTLGETFVYRRQSPLTCDLTAYGGLEDEEVTVEDLKAWECYTSARFNYRMFPGNHFFLQQHEQLVLERLVSDLLT